MKTPNKKAKTKTSGSTTQTWVRYSVNADYLKLLEQYYALPWYKRLFRRPPQ